MKLPDKNEIRKPSKTLAGVTPIAVMSYPKKCQHGTCLYCPSLNVPQSYTPKSPPVLRAERLKYNPCEQVKSRLKAFQLMNHPTQKIELIIMGGNFLEYPLEYQYEFVKECYDALNDSKNFNDNNDYSSHKHLNHNKINTSINITNKKLNLLKKELEQAKKLNEKAKHSCVALCIETRPDSIDEKTIKRILEFGCTRVELGVQCLDDKIYKKINRGHKVKEVIEATKKLKESGFKVGYHLMLGLPLSNPSKDYNMFVKLFKNENFKPDQLKIYPCQVIKGAQLEKLYKKGLYKPYNQLQIEKLLEKIMLIIPNYCRIMRIMREIPPDYLIAGIKRIDLRRDMDISLKKEKAKIDEIRFREIGFAVRDNLKINKTLKLKITNYKASKGNECFLEFINKDNILFGLLRLRINNKTKNKDKTAIIREVHVYGQALLIGEKGKGFGQHLGLGKQLIKKAEEIVKKENIKELKIISGIGAREYYKKLGYKLDKEKTYMEKRL